MGGSYFHSLADIDFDSDFERFDTAQGYGAITLSKGLPDLIDTLRLDVSGFGEIADLGAGRLLRELGVRTRLGMRPTVETILYIRILIIHGWANPPAYLQTMIMNMAWVVN